MRLGQLLTRFEASEDTVKALVKINRRFVCDAPTDFKFHRSCEHLCIPET